MTRRKKAWVAASGALILFFLIGIMIFFAVSQNEDDQPEPFNQELILPKEVQNNREVAIAFQQKDYRKAIQLSQEYAENESIDTSLRLSMLGICIDSATAISDSTSKGECNLKAQALIPQLNIETDKEPWSKQIEAKMNGTVYLGEGDSDLSQ